MNPIERIKNAFKLQPVDQIPWVPFVGVHAGYLLDLEADKFLSSRQNLVNGIRRAIELYQPDGIPLLFDLQLEAEALSCKLNWSKDNPPAVISHPLAEGKGWEDLPEFSPDRGRISLVLEAGQEIKKYHPEVALYGLVTGPFTLALHLAGTDIFIRMLEDPAGTTELLDHCKQIALDMSKWYLEAGCDVIALVDPMTSQIDPFSFESFVNPPMSEIFNYIRESQALSSFFVCGYAQQNIEAMCACQPDNISIDENIPLDYVKEVALAQNISFGGNLQLTTELLLGNPQSCQIHAWETMKLGGDHGFILAPGCDLPMKTPVENLQAIRQLVNDPYLQEVTDTLQREQDRFAPMDLSNHWSKDKLQVDIITLDSSSCAPCQYMVEAVQRAAQVFGPQVVCQEYSIKTEEGIRMMKSLGVRNVPVTVIEGEITFVSQIPHQKAIAEVMAEKIRQKGI
ncbi:MAG: uroporphyrinogen decarboxylase family protein [Candidatus Cyclobacteriaceae bacterium M3_2C_046]